LHTPPPEKITKNERDLPGLFFNCILDFENEISRQDMHFMGGFRMIDKFSHKFVIRRSMRFKRTIDPDIFAHK
jgi:hypothetical protein